MILSNPWLHQGNLSKSVHGKTNVTMLSLLSCMYVTTHRRGSSVREIFKKRPAHSSFHSVKRSKRPGRASNGAFKKSSTKTLWLDFHFVRIRYHNSFQETFNSKRFEKVQNRPGYNFIHFVKKMKRPGRDLNSSPWLDRPG